mgnify:CR=1 FL=1
MAHEKIMGKNMRSESLSPNVRWFRATLVDSAHVESTIVFEFQAPFPIDPKLDYKQWAIHALLHELSSNRIKIRDIEPVEINPKREE